MNLIPGSLTRVYQSGRLVIFVVFYFDFCRSAWRPLGWRGRLVFGEANLHNSANSPWFLLQTVCVRMAQLLDGAGKLGWVLLRALVRFVFMFFNNCVAIPSYCLYLLLLQPLRIWDSSAFWHIEGVMFKWLLAMVSSWGWLAGYTG